MNQLVQIYQSVPPDVLALVFGAIGVSALQQKIKNWLELENPKVLLFMTTAFSLAAAVIPAALGFLSANPGAIGTHTAMFFTGMTLAYRYVVQPGSVKLNSFKDDVAKVKALRARQTAATDGVSPAPSELLFAPAPGTVTTPAQNTNEFDG